MHPRHTRLAALVIAGLVTVLGLVRTVPAQPTPGDLVVATGSTISVISLKNRRISTLATAPSLSERFIDLCIDAGNNAIVALRETGSSGASALLRISPTGSQATITTLNAGYSYGFGQVVLDQDGSYVVGKGPRLLRVSGSGVTTLADRLLGNVTGLTRDGDTGDLVAFAFQVPYLSYMMRRDAVTGRLTTIGSWPGAHSIAHDQATGHFWSGGFGSSLTLLDRDTGALLTTVKLPTPEIGDIVVDQPTSLIFITSRSNHVSAVQLVSPTGVVIGTYAYLINEPFHSVHMWGSRRLGGTGSGDRGSTYTLKLSLTQSPGAAYCCALSFAGMRPGFRFGLTTAHIAPDGLFDATVCGRLPGFTSDFAGKLDAAGSATATFVIPSFIPIGTVYTAAAVAVNPTLPGGVEVTEAIAIAVTR